MPDRLFALFKAFGWVALILSSAATALALLYEPWAERIWTYHPADWQVFSATVIALGSILQALRRCPAPAQARERRGESSRRPTDAGAVAAGSPACEATAEEGGEASDETPTPAPIGAGPARYPAPMAPGEMTLYLLAALWLLAGLVQAAAIALELELDSLRIGGTELLYPRPYRAAWAFLFVAAYLGVFGHACTLARRLEGRLQEAA